MDRRKRVVFQTEWFQVEEEYFDDVPGLAGQPYYRISSPNGVMVLAQTEAGQIILVKQFRPVLNEYTLELPSGAIDDPEPPETAAARELYEETGYVCASLMASGKGRVLMNRSDCWQFGFWGTGAVKDPHFQPQEDIEVVLVNPEEFKNLVRSGEFHQLAALATLVLTEWNLGIPFP